MSESPTAQELRQAIDRMAITDLMARYAFWIDYRLDKKAEWVDLFTEDGVWALRGAAEFRGREEIGHVIEIVRGSGLALHHGQSNAVIDIDGDRAFGNIELNVFLLADGQVHNTLFATYDDVYRRENGRWRFESRTVVASEAGAALLTGTFEKHFRTTNERLASWVTDKSLI